jgi:hypothetical protein
VYDGDGDMGQTAFPLQRPNRVLVVLFSEELSRLEVFRGATLVDVG